MARIRAGNTLANQYAPPFSISSGIASGWMLQWDDRLKAFTAFDPETGIEPSGFENILAYEIVATQNQTFVIVPFQVPSKEMLFVTINGVKQHQDAYHINIVNYGDEAMGVTFVVTELDEPIEAGDRIEFLGLQASDPTMVRVQSFIVDDYQASGVYWLNWVAPSKESLIISFNGVKQHVSSYNLTPVGMRTRLEFINDPPDFVVPQPDIGQGANDIWLEVIGILDARSGTGRRVEAANINDGVGDFYGTFLNQTGVGDLQLLNFRSFRAGDHIFIDELVDTSLEINSRTMTNIGAGVRILDNPNPVDADPFEFRELAGTAGEISLTVVADTIILSQDKGYVFTNGPTFAIPTNARLVGVRGVPATVTLPTPGGLTPTGTRILIKDEGGNAGVTPITVNAASGRTIDGAASTPINTAYGWVQVYTDGTNWFIVG